MTTKKNIYWYCQIIGWSFYIILNSIFLGLNYNSGLTDYLLYFFMLPAGITISHLYREVVIRWKVLNKPIPFQLVFIIVFSFIKAVIFFLVILALTSLFNLQLGHLTIFDALFEFILNFTVVFTLWNVIYFGFQYFQNYKKAEINSLRYLAASRESELNNLKAQLNPHFIFNCMNSIRALVDENPDNAKAAVTRLSNILRNTLKLDKNREISLNDELSFVSDYLELEKFRFEERLHFEYQIQEEVKTAYLPPFLLQSQVENAVKHGISKLPGVGQIIVEAFADDDKLHLRVSNSGKIVAQEPLTGVGFKNSLQRIELLYGNEGKITIREKGDWVVVDIILPLKNNRN